MNGIAMRNAFLCIQSRHVHSCMRACVCATAANKLQHFIHCKCVINVLLIIIIAQASLVSLQLFLLLLFWCSFFCCCAVAATCGMVISVRVYACMRLATTKNGQSHAAANMPAIVDYRTTTTTSRITTTITTHNIARHISILMLNTD